MALINSVEEYVVGVRAAVDVEAFVSSALQLVLPYVEQWLIVRIASFP